MRTLLALMISAQLALAPLAMAQDGGTYADLGIGPDLSLPGERPVTVENFDPVKLCRDFKRAPGAAAVGSSSFSPGDVYCAIIEFYGFYAGSHAGSDQLTEVDKLEMALALADMVSVLPNESFNDVLWQLNSDYYNIPEFREAIELMLLRTYDKVSPELRLAGERHLITTVIDDIFYVGTVAYMFGLGRGIWRGRGSGLKGIARFRHIRDAVVRSLPRGRRNALAMIGIGTTIAIVQTVMDRLSTHKVDPRSVLQNAQDKVVTDLGTQMAAIRDELKAVTGPMLQANPQRYRDRLNELDPKISKYRVQLEHLFDAAPALRSRMQPIASDLTAVRTLISRLTMQLDRLDAGPGWGDPALP